MFNLSTLTALAVDPAVTLSVIAVLTVLLVLSILDGRRRLNAFAVKSAKMSARLTASLVAAVIESAQKEMKRREAKTIGWTYDQLKRIGFDKLALMDVFSMDDLKSALRPGEGPKRREAGPRPYQETDVEDAAGLEAGPRPYHTARSPRAG